MSLPIVFLLNRDAVQIGLPQGALLLDFIRRERRLTGTKEACREGDCGACLVLLGKSQDGQVVYRPVNSCLLPLGAAAGRHVVTIEGINSETLNPVQQALVDCGAIQCGYCTPGIVMALTAFFLNGAVSDYAAALDAAAGNLCRCTGYAGIKRAIANLCTTFDLSQSPPQRRLQDLVAWRLLPDYFLSVAERLAALPVHETRARVGANSFFPKLNAANLEDVIVAGGTDLFVQRPEALVSQGLCFIAEESELQGIQRQGLQLLIGAGTTIEALRTSPMLQELFPAINEDFKLLCSAPIRQRATVGGNFVNASPIGDLSVFFLALNAELHISSAAARRSVPLRQFFLGYKRVDLQPGEHLETVAFECPEGLLYSFEKVAKRRYLDIAAVNSALSLTHDNGIITGAHLAAGGVAPTPLYLAASAAYLLGRSIDAETVRGVAAIAQTEIAPISDIRGSADYKRLLLRQLIYAHFLKLFPHLLRWEDLYATD